MVEMDDLLSGGNGNDELIGRNDADKFECSDGNDKTRQPTLKLLKAIRRLMIANNCRPAICPTKDCEHF